MSATLTSRLARCTSLGWAAALAVTLHLATTGSSLGRDVTFTSPKAALEQGLNAYRGGYVEIALPALRYAAANNEFLGQFMLATILADNNNAHTDHPQAFRLFQDIAELASRIDPDDDPRAPYVARALVATAGYLRRGVPEARVRVDAERAVQLLHTAASFFGNPDAQLELAKMLLTGEGGRKDAALALHFLSTLSREGHPAALALFAELHWRGKHVARDEVRALALAALAVKRALPTDRIWIEEVYQAIYCGTGDGARRQAEPKVNRWDRAFGAAVAGMLRQHRTEADTLAPTRTCANGEPVPLLTTDRAKTPPRVLTLPGESDGKLITARPAAPVSREPLLGVDAK